jgi:hypothetical protein
LQKRLGYLTANARPLYVAARELETGAQFAFNPRRFSLVDELTLTRYQVRA